MSAYKEMAISDREDQIVDICDQCSGGIHKGQQVWKVGSEIYCCRDCLQTGLQIVTLRI